MTSPSIVAANLHHHNEKGVITMHLPQKEDLDSKASDEGQKVRKPINGEAQNGVNVERRERYGHVGYSGMQIAKDRPATIRSLAKDVERLREQLRSTEKELEKANERHRDAETNLDALKKANYDLLQELQNNKEREAIDIQTAQKLAKDVERKSSEQETENIILRERLRASEDTIQRMSAVLRERTDDLKGVQTFLNSADLYSGAEVISMVESLNTDFFQISAFVADLVEEEGMFASEEEWSANKSNLVPSLSNDVHFFAGNKLYAHICNAAAQLRTDALPLQLGLQALLAGWCVYHIRIHCWGPLNNRLQEVYRNIQSSETQAVSGRWRAITTANLVEDYSKTKRLLDVILNVLHLCGWSSASSQSQKAVTTIEDMLTSMQNQIVLLRKAVREGITTADLEVIAHTPGTAFQEEAMEDIYKTSNDVAVEPGVKSNNRILCTVGVGVRKFIGKTKGESSGQVGILLRPQVVLESILNDPDIFVRVV